MLARCSGVQSWTTVVFVLFALHGCATPPSGVGTYAYSWTPVDESLTNIVPFHYLRQGGLQDLPRMLSQAKAAAERMPPGHRVLFSWDLHRDMAYHSEDVIRRPDGEPAGCRTTDGRFIPYRGVWWGRGVEQVRKRTDDWFRRYQEIGGEIDVLVLDFEQGFFYWSLYYRAEERYPCGLAAYLDAIERDPRFPEIARATGLEKLDRLEQWYRYDDYLRWDAVARERLADYVNRAVYEPVARYFPEVKFSNYDYYHQAPSLGMMDINGHEQHRYGAGRHVGTHQSRALYGWLGNLRDVSLDGIEPYGATPFNAFRYAVNEMRVMKLSSPVPVSPWVSNKEFGDSLLRYSDLYQELIYHVVLSGVDHLLYWNALSTDSPATPTSNRLLSALLRRIDEVGGAEPGEPLFDGLVPWRQPYVLTGARKSGQRVWRFTPRLAEGESLDDVLVSADPAVFEVEGVIVRIPGGRVQMLEPRLSKQGFWIVDRP